MSSSYVAAWPSKASLERLFASRAFSFSVVIFRSFH
ncbi:hypothetical protein GPA_13330 [Gordonibacter pamelaeae 7-10-1-b]|uniref:Uncharacterized protein n=1 Tax=Gordonibacter pamelaeae 7-10-1-b TaxID=657308 RepID=D6E8C3_9ACTN|nr:hypothetical protein GPA_13330 [Gordonibacter pamelaeae 7-10-1-b]